ncbi:unnamed protein product, partial [Prorocentrum cordatum]
RRRAKVESLVEGTVASLSAMARCEPGRALRAEERRRLFGADILPVQHGRCAASRATLYFVPVPVASGEFPDGALAGLDQHKPTCDLDANTAQADYDRTKLLVYLEDPDSLIVLPPEGSGAVGTPVKAQWDPRFSRPGSAKRDFIVRLDE